MTTEPATHHDLSTVVKAYDIRGLVPQQWGPREAAALGAAAADVLCDAGGGGRRALVIGHDMRASSPQLVDAFAAGAERRGVDTVLIGLCSTDGLYYASGALQLPGAMFTASHNPSAYNGIKLCRSGARAVGRESGLAAVQQLAEEYLRDGLPGSPGTGARSERDVLGDYARHLRSLVDLRPLGSAAGLGDGSGDGSGDGTPGRRLTVVVDAGNGMAGHTVPAVLGDEGGLDPLPLDVVPLYFELDGTFPHHEANPLEPANLRDLQRAVVAHGADLGLAFDGDADRCFVVDERGVAVNPSAVTALVALREVAKEQLAGRRPVVLHNLITSRVVPELVTRAGGTAVRTRVGHSYIKAEMARTGAVFGGEHSAHYYFRDFWGADTGMLAALHVLAALAESGGTLSSLVGEYDPYASSGEINSTVPDPAAAAEAVLEAFSAGRPVVDRLDGLTVSEPEGGWWFNLRASNTEPLLRLNVEAREESTMRRVRDDVLRLVRHTGDGSGPPPARP